MATFLMSGSSASIAVFSLAGVAAADPIVTGEEHCVVYVRADDRLNIRAAPNDRAAIVGSRRYGDCGIHVTSPCRGKWCLVEEGHVQGWVHRRFIAMVSPALYCVTGVAERDTLNLRAWPSLQSRVVARLGQHQCGIAFLPYADGAWQKVRAGDRQGWVKRSYLSGQ